MAEGSAALLAIAESVADGSAIDWSAIESSVESEHRSIVRELRVLAEVAALHRTMPVDPDRVVGALPAPRPTTAAIGQWAHLDLIIRLGGGTFGEVFRAWDRHLEREVALKLLRVPDTYERDLGSSRIVAEGRLLARLNHPNVVTVYGVAVHEGRVGLWMELLNGPTLEQALRAGGTMSAREAANIGIELCRALAALHAAGLIHRDIKTQNVIREPGGRIVLMDLGTGRALDPHRPYPLPDLAGTPLYLAPELLEGGTASERTDLYSLGVLLYRLVTGAFPVRATTMDELRDAHATHRAVRLRDARADLPSAFVRVVDRAIAETPDERYATAGELEGDLLKTVSNGHAEPLGPQAPGRLGRVGRWVAVAAAVVVLGVVGFLAMLRAPNSVSRPAVPGPGTIRSIAVLPLANLSNDPSQQYFADGLTDELIGTLGRIGQLNVISRTSIAQLETSGRLLPDIARTLHVDAILEGSVLVAPATTGGGVSESHVRINARLIYAGTDTQLWDRTFDHVFTDLLALQSDVATAVAEEIHVRLTPEQRARLGGSDTRNAEAARLYLEGRANLTAVAPDRLLSARRAFERALQLDPTYARAHSALAVCAIWLRGAGRLSSSDARTIVMREARRALQLDPDLPEAHAVLADAQLFYERNWSAAEAGYRRALDINPSYSWARTRYSEYLEATGRLEDALAEARRAQQADPLSPDATAAVGMALYYNRQYDEAIEQFQHAVALAPAAPQEHIGLARAYSAKQMPAEALREANEAIRLSGGDVPVFRAELARTLAAAGQTGPARALLNSLEHPSVRQMAVPPEELANGYVALGDADRALQLLQQSLRERTTGLLWVAIDPRLDRLRNDPRFTAFLQQVRPRP